MELVIGQVVESTAGKDKNQLLVVTRTEENKVYLCDGKQRPLQRAKAKNIKHIKATKTVLSNEKMATNRELRRSLKQLSDA
ncbi:MAG: KOW domain-containing RNA-binding protein [Clostridia bacterium]|nr:KOW domain-containing RNA-binding protein [Clostridia bacterium]